MATEPPVVDSHTATWIFILWLWCLVNTLAIIVLALT